MTASDVIRAAIPDASDSLCEHILWARTPFPCDLVTVRDLYKSADGFRRARSRGVILCDFCERVAAPGSDLCLACDGALHSKPNDALAREENDADARFDASRDEEAFGE